MVKLGNKLNWVSKHFLVQKPVWAFIKTHEIYARNSTKLCIFSNKIHGFAFCRHKKTTMKAKFLKTIFFITCSFFTTDNLFAQELLLPLKSNSALKNQRMPARVQSVVALSLPFIDDFSGALPYPNPSLWADAAVYINPNYGVNAPTYGVATFDGLNGIGEPYDNSTSNTYGVADYLTSQPINLGNKAPSDSVYLSFFFQPEGLGEQPDAKDSLVVQLKKSNGDWVSVWRKGGTILKPFKQVLLPVRNSAYFHGDFQFRFLNYASLTGNLDHWHIDYVRLAAVRTHTDTLIDDVSFRYTPQNMLAPYTQVPYSQLNGSNWQKPNLEITAKNLSTGARNLAYRYAAFNQTNNASISISPPNNVALGAGNEFLCVYPTTNIPILPQDSLQLKITYTLNTTPDANRSNDTVTHIQDFFNEFAYDDGSAEYGYGLNVTGGQIAYKFKLNRPDTLRAIKMHFAQIIEPINSSFSLRIWKHIANATNPSDLLLYEQEVTLSATDYGYINDFGTLIRLDTALALTDSFYIGWQQPDPKLLNIGLDRNNNPQNVRFYNINGSWLPSNISGTWLMRPVLNGNNLQFAGNQGLESAKLMVYPNPATDYIAFDLKTNCDAQIIDILGNVVGNYANVLGKIDVSKLARGVYFVRITEKNGKVFGAKFVK